MKLEFTIAADVALVALPPQPISAESPASSSAVTPSTPIRDQGSCAPTRAQPIPSSTRCLARSRTEAGTSSSVVFATQVASLPVGPAGSVAGRPAAVTAVGVPEVILVLLYRSWRTGGAASAERHLGRLTSRAGFHVFVDDQGQRLFSRGASRGR